MEVDEVENQKMPINPEAQNEFKYLTVKNLSSRTSIDRLFKQMVKSLEKQYGITFTSKTHTLAIKLENGELIVMEKNDQIKKANKLADHFITRFSTIKFFAYDKVQSIYKKAVDDFINIEFPDYIRKEPIRMPIGNSNFDVKKII